MADLLKEELAQFKWPKIVALAGECESGARKAVKREVSAANAAGLDEPYYKVVIDKGDLLFRIKYKKSRTRAPGKAKKYFANDIVLVKGFVQRNNERATLNVEIQRALKSIEEDFLAGLENNLDEIRKRIKEIERALEGSDLAKAQQEITLAETRISRAKSSVGRSQLEKQLEDMAGRMNIKPKSIDLGQYKGIIKDTKADLAKLQEEVESLEDAADYMEQVVDKPSRSDLSRGAEDARQFKKVLKMLRDVEEKTATLLGPAKTTRIEAKVFLGKIKLLSQLDAAEDDDAPLEKEVIAEAKKLYQSIYNLEEKRVFQIDRYRGGEGEVTIEANKLSANDKSKFLQAIGGRLPPNSIYSKSMRCSNALSDAKKMLMGAMKRYGEFEKSKKALRIGKNLEKIDSI